MTLQLKRCKAMQNWNVDGMKGKYSILIIPPITGPEFIGAWTLTGGGMEV